VATIVVCPNCGNHFPRPFFTERRFGVGFSIGPMGAIKCPSCGYKAGWGVFKKEKDAPPSSGDFSSGKPSMPPPSNQVEEKEKSLEETKYDQS